MKLWLQSGSGLSSDGATAYGKLYEDSLARRLKAVARPGTSVDVFGIAGTPYGKDRYHAAKHKVVTGVIESALRAEGQGYDAVAVVNTFDHGYYELRELLRIPVVFITESTLYLACQLAPSFAVIGHNRQIQLQVEELAKRYGLASRMVRGESLDLTYDAFPRMYEDPETFIHLFREMVKGAIERGAGAFLVAGNPLNMFLVDQGLTDVDGVPLVDGCAATVKTAEMMVDLRAVGIERGRTGLFAAPPDDDLAKLRGLFE
jgi:allantoin racemase